MATKRTAIKLDFDYYTNNGQVNRGFTRTYHPDFVFKTKYGLYWNTGSGYTTSVCVNANGNTSFNSSWRCVYVGAGTPSDAAAGVSVPVTASSLLGVSCGLVLSDDYSYTQISNVGAFANGVDFYEYEKYLKVNYPTFGTVNFKNSTYGTSDTEDTMEWILPSVSLDSNSSYADTGRRTIAIRVLVATPKDGYVFLGWYEDGELLSSDTTYTMGLNDASYEARFSFNFTVAFDANGGTGTMASQSFQYGETKNLLKNEFTRDGYVFAGWSSTPDGEVQLADEADGSVLADTPDSTVTLYAVWRRPNITITNLYPERGSLSLFSVTDNKKVADEYTDGTLAYEGTEGDIYRVDAEVSKELYQIKGVYVDGEYFNPYQFTLGSEAVARDFYFDEKTVFSITLDCTPDGNTASVTSPSEPDKDGKYVEGRSVTVTGVPAAGYKLKAANIINAETNLSVGSFDNIEDNTFTIDDLRWSIIAKLTFVKENYKIAASVDSASSAAIPTVSVEMNDEVIATATYGDEVVFSGTPADGYEFDGWYEGDVRISEEAEYTHMVTGGISLVAKAKVAISMAISYNDNRGDTSVAVEESCSVLIGGEAVEMPFYVTLGDSFSYALVLGALGDGTEEVWKFDAWYENDVATPYGASGEIVPLSRMDLVAKVTSKAIVRTVTVEFLNDETKDAVAVDASALTATPAPASTEVEGNTITLDFEGTQNVEFSFADEITASESLAFAKVVAGGVEYPDLVFKILVNGDIEMSAYYGATGERTTSVTYADGCDRTMGEIVIEGLSSTTNPVPMSVIKNRGESVKLKVLVKNGYRFVGWYLRPEAVGSAYLTEADVVFKVSTNRVLYAKFAKDPNAIYKWEGSSENKMMTWRSKTYEASKPFNPSACRVDTRGYPVWELSVEMFSAPDASPTAIATLNNVASQDSRRLPIRRMERYMQIAIENNNEVDAVLVGTSMGGLAV